MGEAMTNKQFDVWLEQHGMSVVTELIYADGLIRASLLVTLQGWLSTDAIYSTHKAAKSGLKRLIEKVISKPKTGKETG